MFVDLARAMVLGGAAPDLQTAANTILSVSRPYQIVDFLEEYWRQGVYSARDLSVPAGLLPDHEDHGRDVAATPIDPAILAAPAAPNFVEWDHLALAFMLEQTRMYSIFRRLITEYLDGERLPHPTHATQRWLRNTEELFFSAHAPLSVRTLTSRLRPDDEAIRRNLYFRMLGMDLTHGTDDGRAYVYSKPDAANRDFVILFETLLSEVWRGYTNRAAALATTNDSDDNAMATLVRRLYEMLTARRHDGRLSREEFDAVATLSWFRLVVLANTQVVNNLSVQAAGEADRLRRIGEMVGVPAHSRADAFFQLAEPMSFVLRHIEGGRMGNSLDVALGGNPQNLYINGSIYQQRFLAIITNWSIATGRNLKDVSVRPATLPVLTETIRGQSVTTSGNGQYSPASRIPAGMLR